LTDGKIGDLVQCRGVASALTDLENISEMIVEPGWITSLPIPFMPLSAVDRQSPLLATGADIIIASGRRTVPYLRALKRRKGRRCFTVFLKDPKFNHAAIDVIWAPQHDQLSAPNAFSTTTSPHAITPQKLIEAQNTARERFDDFASPNAGLVLGGSAKSVDWSGATISRLSSVLQALPGDTGILITASRRTPEALLDSVQHALRAYKTSLWTGDGPNPYVEMLAWCDRIIVTGDSHNMVSEALTSGCPVHIFRPDGLHRKIHAFLDGLEQDGLVEDVSAGFERTSGQPLNATPDIAAVIKKRFLASR